jgi:hypothetical protein
LSRRAAFIAVRIGSAESTRVPSTSKRAITTQ